MNDQECLYYTACGNFTAFERESEFPVALAVIVKCTVSTGKELQQAELFNEIISVYLQFKTD